MHPLRVAREEHRLKLRGILNDLRDHLRVA
jgi:hypothetical protein